jgi:nucleotide-binding universal stress UspA family protein
MRGLSASEIMGVWERGRGRTLPERALQLLAAGGHPESPELVSVGERDALLLELRAVTCGTGLAAVAPCPSCGELLELELASEDLLALETARAEPLELEVGERTVRFRVPTAGDLVAVGEAGGVEEGRALLLERCVGEALSPDLEEAVATRMALADPGAWTYLALACPGCEHEWATPFDVVSFFWAELEALARRLVREVHELASAYGWRESDVLALSADRREAYLELART